MKCKVINGFIDKETGTGHNVGQFLDLSDERFKELHKKGFVTKAVEPKKEVKIVKK